MEESKKRTKLGPPKALKFSVTSCFLVRQTQVSKGSGFKLILKSTLNALPKATVMQWFIFFKSIWDAKNKYINEYMNK